MLLADHSAYQILSLGHSNALYPSFPPVEETQIQKMSLN